MTWEYALIGLVVGVVIGAVAMRFGNRKLRQQQVLQMSWRRAKQIWKSIVKSWLGTSHGVPSYWITWPVIIVSFINIWRKAPITYYRTYHYRIIRSVTV